MPKTKSSNKPPQKSTVTEFTCGSCGEIKKSSDFYISYNPMHKTNLIPYCKKCLRSMAHNEYGEIKLDKFKNMLQYIDRPFLFNYWNSSIIDTRLDTFGAYMKNLSLQQNRYLTWKDSTLGDDLKLNGVTNEVELKRYSKQWVGEYTKSDIDYLDNYLQGLHADFKIVTENHKDYARKIAKSSLHMDKCFQEMLQGVNGADKRYKDARETFDTLSKSANFSENTRGINDVSLGGFGVTFDRVEQKTWIPKHIVLEKDAIDKIIDAFNTIEKSL